MGEPLPNTEPQRAVSPWLRFVLICDRAGLGFFFAPVLTLASPWPALITALWVAIGLAAVWLALLGVATAAGLALAMRSNIDVGEDFWRSIVAYPPAEAVNRTRRAGS